jgi:hypothetical protein
MFGQGEHEEHRRHPRSHEASRGGRQASVYVESQSIRGTCSIENGLDTDCKIKFEYLY